MKKKYLCIENKSGISYFPDLKIGEIDNCEKEPWQTAKSGKEYLTVIIYATKNNNYTYREIWVPKKFFIDIQESRNFKINQLLEG